MDNFQDDFAHGAYLLWGTAALGGSQSGTVNSGSSPGVLKFDIVSNEEVEREVEITEHPVERGADVADHARRKLRLIKLETFVSQEPLDPSLYGQSGNGVVQNVALALPQYPQHPGLSTVGGATVAAIDALRTAPQQPFQALVYTTPFDSLAIVLGLLDDLIANSTLIDVATRSFYYANYLLKNVSTKRDKDTGSGTIIVLEVREVRFVNTKQVGAPPLPAKPKDKPPVSKGSQQPSDAPASSVLNNLLFGGS